MGAVDANAWCIKLQFGVKKFTGVKILKYFMNESCGFKVDGHLSSVSSRHLETRVHSETGLIDHD